MVVCHRSILYEWHDIINCNSDARTFINDCLEEIEYPHSINHYPRDFGNYGKWKASQLRTFMMYIALWLLIRLPLVMGNCFPEIYVFHFSLFLIYARVLRHFTDSTEISNTPIFIQTYLRLFSSLYNECKELYSVHAMAHLWE